MSLPIPWEPGWLRFPARNQLRGIRTGGHTILVRGQSDSQGNGVGVLPSPRPCGIRSLSPVFTLPCFWKDLAERLHENEGIPRSEPNFGQRDSSDQCPADLGCLTLWTLKRRREAWVVTIAVPLTTRSDRPNPCRAGLKIRKDCRWKTRIHGSTEFE
jgi:hypothetical protein